MQVDAATFREVLGHLPTGVTVVCADTPDGPAGMAVNSFTSVSLEPPLVSFCPARTSTTWPGLQRAGRFTASVVAAGGAELARVFARQGVDRFEGVGWHERPTGPGLDDAVAWIECELEAEHPGGDHTIVVARVIATEVAPGREPLVFFRGGYGDFVSNA